MERILFHHPDGSIGMTMIVEDHKTTYDDQLWVQRSNSWLPVAVREAHGWRTDPQTVWGVFTIEEVSVPELPDWVRAAPGPDGVVVATPAGPGRRATHRAITPAELAAAQAAHDRTPDYLRRAGYGALTALLLFGAVTGFDTSRFAELFSVGWLIVLLVAVVIAASWPRPMGLLLWASTLGDRNRA